MESTVNEPTEEDYETTPMNTQHPLNTILFGPPGTGKTYSTLLRAMSIIDDQVYENPSDEEIEVLKGRYKKLLHAGQIDFVTFHQSFTYEDFIEGIKPVMDSDREESDSDKKSFLEYEIADGAFKRLSESARESTRLASEKGSSDIVLPGDVLANANFNKISLLDAENPNDVGIYEYCINNGCIAIGYGDDHDFTKATNEAEVLEEFQKTGGEEVSNRSYNVIAIKCLKFWMKTGDVVFATSGHKHIRAIGIVEGEYEFKSVPEIAHRHFRKVKWLYTDLNLPVQSVYERNFSSQPFCQLFRSKIKLDFFDSRTVGGRIKPYVLIIDEINRGNIANIFGELITLIEDDKRDQAENEITVKLPYSKKPFSVPANLHLIGTMNTADRSVEALDTALRRRFSFVEMPPKYDFPSFEETVHGIRIKDLLVRINTRIEKLLDKDHLIGHAYFLKVNAPVHAERELQLKMALQNKVLPLLQEYFFGDFGKIGLVMGQGFVVPGDSEENNKNIFANFEHEASDQFAEKTVYQIVDVLDKNFDLADALEQLMK
jgi:5-methylcytosine-specific restriction endonuclease McrBC GTP-binding regulatory subunit McrB